jgi:hypothetical protein
MYSMDVDIYGAEVMTAAYGVGGRTRRLQCVFSSVVSAVIVMIYAIYGYSTLWKQIGQFLAPLSATKMMSNHLDLDGASGSRCGGVVLVRNLPIRVPSQS